MAAGMATAAPSLTPDAADVLATAGPSASPERPEWFDLEMTDVLTGQPFTINDFAGKVVLLETMAVWCPTCRQQGDEVVRLHELLGNPTDLVSISLDTDMGEDAALLKKYAETLGYDWNIAVAPLLVARALGNLYSAQYLNPPLSPMLIIDRSGQVLGLPFGLKSAEDLQGVVSPLLGP
jgi:thiol-disulfide isomerase/thioredoxin